MTLPDDLKAELERALDVLPCTCDVAYSSRQLIAPDCSRCQYIDEVRAALVPILERLNEAFLHERKSRLLAESLYERLLAKIAAVEAERDEMDRVNGEIRRELDAKLAQAEAAATSNLIARNAAEAERDTWKMEAARMQERFADLDGLYAKQAALLARRPHLEWQGGDQWSAVETHARHGDQLRHCARLGGACAK